MSRRGAACATLMILAACNGFDGFSQVALQTAGGVGRRVPGDGDLSSPRFAEGGGGTWLAIEGRDEFGLDAVFLLNSVSLERVLASRANAVTDPFTGETFEPIPDRGSFDGTVATSGLRAVFISTARNMLGDEITTMDRAHAYLRDVAAERNVLVDRGFDGLEGNGDVLSATISADGRFAIFSSDATNLVPAADSGTPQVFLLDLVAGFTELLSYALHGGVVFPGNAASTDPVITADGSFAAFVSEAQDLVDEDTNPGPDVFLRDRTRRTTERVSFDPMGGDTLLEPGRPALSGDGTVIAFAARPASGAPFQIFVRDRIAGTTALVSFATAAAGGGPGDGDSTAPAMSADGRFVAFQSDATDLVDGDTNGVTDVFVFDRVSGRLERVSVNIDGVEGDGESRDPTMSPDGTVIGFVSRARNLVEPTDAEPTPPNTTLDLYFFANPLSD